MLSSAEEDLESAMMVQEHEQERRHQVSLEWDEERSRLITVADEAQRTREALESELDKTRGALLAKEQEVSVLTAELEAQWKNTEVTSERMEELKREKLTLQNELVSLEGKLESMETDWSSSENKRLQMENEINEALAARDELDRQRDQVCLTLVSDAHSLPTSPLLLAGGGAPFRAGTLRSVDSVSPRARGPCKLSGARAQVCS